MEIRQDENQPPFRRLVTQRQPIGDIRIWTIGQI